MTPLEMRIAIAELYDTGKIAGKATVQDIVVALGSPEGKQRSVGIALKRLGFERGDRRRAGSTRKSPFCEWTPPAEWPADFKAERRMRQLGMDSGQVQRASLAAFGMGDVLDDAIDALLIGRVEIGARGKLKAEIKRIVVDTLAELREDSIARRELAEWLREAPDANKQFLENRVKGLVRIATRRSNSP